MVLDECIATPATREAARESMERSIRWARRARDRFLQLKADPSLVAVTNPGQAQFGIVQGATFPDLRAESVAGDDRPSGSRRTPLAASAWGSRRK